MRCQRRDPSDRIVQFDQFVLDLAIRILNKDPSTNPQVPVPPRRVQSSGIGSYPELDIAMGIRLLGHGFQLSRKSINMANNNSDTLSRSITSGDGKRNQRRAVASDVVLSSMLQLGVPRIALREPPEPSRLKTVGEVLNCMKNGRVCTDEVQKGFRIVLGVYS